MDMTLVSANEDERQVPGGVETAPAPSGQSITAFVDETLSEAVERETLYEEPGAQSDTSNKRDQEQKHPVIVDRGRDPGFKAWPGVSILPVLQLVQVVIVGGILLLGLAILAMVLVKGLLIPLLLIVGIFLLGRYLWTRSRHGGSTRPHGRPRS
jgi:hypothetical protein